MNMLPKLTVFAGLISVTAFHVFAAGTTTSINADNKFAYNANLGWLDGRGDTNHGAVIGEYVCAGYVYSANVGWIDLGGGTPANGIRYQNDSATDFGVNHDGLGNLRGYAWGANIGWINFEDTGAPKLDLYTGNLSGYAYSANCGWISLSNAVAHVQTDYIQPGTDSDGDGIADAWELSHTNNLTAFSGKTDVDGDGVSDLDEYLADTDPLNSKDHLQITTYTTQFGGGNETNSLAWTSKETRVYLLSNRTNLNAGNPWIFSADVVPPDPGSSTSHTLILPGSPLSQRFFRVQAFRPLTP